MEPNEPANNTPTNTAGAQGQNAKQPQAGAQGASSTNASSGQNSGDSNNWMDVANLQKLVDQLPQGVKDFCTNSWSQLGKSAGQVGTQFNKLTTTQKVAGVAALAGLDYLALRSGKSDKKSSKQRSMYRGSSDLGYQRQQSYRSGTGHYSASGASGSGYDESRRMDRAPGQYGGFDRQNENRSGGSYQSGNAGSSSSFGAGADYSSGSGYSSGSTNQSSSMGNRSTGYRGTSGSSDSDESDFGSGV